MKYILITIEAITHALLTPLTLLLDGYSAVKEEWSELVEQWKGKI